MSTTSCPVTLDKVTLKSEIRAIYAQVAESPQGAFHFHRGPEYAARLLDYDLAELNNLPQVATASFAGVGNPFLMEPLPPGASVLDIGSGTGMDCLLAARRVGAAGSVTGIDMTDAMLERARAGAAEAGLNHVRFERADITDLPLQANGIDVVISNGVFNLSPDKEAAFNELYRVVKPGGRLQFADITVGVELSESVRNNIDLWTG
ncbi:MAG TPA: methyltransferase domain-containing protein [Verrucomicrobiae bacterium]|nr:methyltransferase domain-containing protein [Verrucomicrobiae bacterium]